MVTSKNLNKQPRLTTEERAILAGDAGPAMQFAMQLVVKAAAIMGATRLLPTNYLHIDACHYYGRAHLDFARFLLKHNAQFEIPAWTNTVPVSLIGEEVRDQADPTVLSESRELADLYLQLGAKPVWTCAPYQLPDHPKFGEHIIVGESNAVANFNSVIGARTNKYGDFLDVACGLTKRVPDAGLHTDSARRGTYHIDVSDLSEAIRETEFFCHVLGHFVGKVVGSAVPVITGLPKETHKDSLKAIAAAAAASGGVGLFHAVGVTPEAPDLETALQGQSAEVYHKITAEELIQARDSLSSKVFGALDMVALGTPHFSYTEFERLIELLDNRQISSAVTFYVTTSRFIAQLAQAKGWLEQLKKAGITVLVDTCTYFSPVVRGCKGTVMTNSAKWAYYAPGMLPVKVAFASMQDCVESAVAGEIRRDDQLWSSKVWSQNG